MDYERILVNFDPAMSRRVVGQEWVLAQEKTPVLSGPTSRVLIQLTDDPAPLLEKYQFNNSTWTRLQVARCGPELTNSTCMKVDHVSRQVFVGTRGGLVQGYFASTFAPATRVMTLSAYAVNNIDVHHHGRDTYLIVAFASGQVSLYKSVNPYYTVT